jgi:hypothetical protein
VLLVAAPDVIDEKVEAALFLPYAGEQGFDLGVRRMVAADGDPLPASVRDRLRRIADRAGKAFGCAAGITAARDVDGRAGFPKGEGDALADAATATLPRNNDMTPSKPNAAVHCSAFIRRDTSAVAGEGPPSVTPGAILTNSSRPPSFPFT